MSSLESFHAVIPAGGAGTRLWPLSRASRPKFLLDLTGSGRSLLQETWDRLRTLVPADRIHVVTGPTHAPLVQQQLPELTGLFVEPSPRDSMPAIGLAAAVIGRRHRRRDHRLLRGRPGHHRRRRVRRGRARRGRGRRDRPDRHHRHRTAQPVDRVRLHRGRRGAVRDRRTLGPGGHPVRREAERVHCRSLRAQRLVQLERGHVRGSHRDAARSSRAAPAAPARRTRPHRPRPGTPRTAKPSSRARGRT